MKKKDDPLLMRERNIIKTISLFLYHNKSKIKELSTQEEFTDFINFFQQLIENESKDYIKMINDQIEDRKKEIDEATQQIDGVRRRNAKKINDLIISIRSLKRNIESERYKLPKNSIFNKYDENYKSTAEVKPYQSYLDKLKIIINEERRIKTGLLKINKNNILDLGKRIDNIQTQVRNLVYNVHDQFNLIKADILAYKENACNYYGYDRKAIFLKEVEYYRQEILKMKVMNGNLRNSINNIFHDYHVANGTDLNELIQQTKRNIVHETISKLIESPPFLTYSGYAKLIKKQIESVLQVNKNVLVEKLRKKENRIKYLRRQLQKIEKNQTLTQTQANIENISEIEIPIVWSQHQVKIAQDLHEIKLMQQRFLSNNSI